MSPPHLDEQAEPMDTATARALFEGELPTIQALARSVCRRYGLGPDEADGFTSWVMERLLDDDLAVIRKFQGRSSLRTYLSVVVSHLWRDHRIKKLGRWYPSAAARRLGPTAVLLDAHLNRQGLSLDESIQVLLARDDVAEDEVMLRQFAVAIPRRPKRLFTGVEAALGVPAEDSSDGAVLSSEAGAISREACLALEAAIHDLPDQDQVILRMHYWEGFTIATISRTLGVEQKPLYRRVEAILRRLRRALEAQGIEWTELAGILPN
jgi:RNA polymerase sigma factor (sigma-70 family)